MASETDLETALLEFDGKHVASLKAATADGLSEDDVRVLCRFLHSQNQRHLVAATWVVKALTEKKQTLAEPIVEAMVDCLNDLEDWQAVLHGVQSASGLVPALNGPQFERYAAFVERHTTNPNKLVRAWAVDALCHVARRGPAFAEKAAAFLAAAHGDAAASVRARARHTSKAFPEFVTPGD
ncbi:hypothetical protein [Cucumibacter marinus]|uniref:hypothetical protein n=1 Tax=Cucumibacter marinus TaxID=1121252 RepID=UPI00040C92AF|nr:hypothetical protein [Cucumibacter marinus]